MEPDVIATLLSFFQAGGGPEKVVDSLSTSFEGLSQLSNLLGCWLSDLESGNIESTSTATLPTSAEEIKTKLECCPAVRECFESTVSKMIARVFSPDAADKIFESVDGNEGLDWLPMLICHKPWRSLIYELVESYPGCLMLNFAVKLISDAGMLWIADSD
jgi:TH1 protein